MNSAKFWKIPRKFWIKSKEILRNFRGNVNIFKSVKRTTNFEEKALKKEVDYWK